MALIRKNTGTSVMLRVYGLFIFLICFYSLNANGNEEQSCNKKFTENLNHVISLLPEGGTPEYGIETTKLEVLGRITQCVELKKCPLSDQLMNF